MVVVYYIKWNDEDIETIMSFKNRLSVSRQKKMERLCFERDQVRSALGELLLRFARNQAHKFFLEPTVSRFGKPQLPDGFFSISHAGEIVVLAYGNVNVGVDVEQMQEQIDYYKCVFSESEQSLIYEAPKELRKERFIRLWTLKESYLKMIGTGFLIDPASISIEMHSDEFFIADITGKHIYLTSFALWETYYLALCTEDQKMCIERVRISELVKFMEGVR